MPTKEEVPGQSHQGAEIASMSKLAGEIKMYRAYLMTREHRIIRPIEIASANDEDAREQAKRHAGCYAVELWDGARKLEYFPSKDSSMGFGVLK